MPEAVLSALKLCFLLLLYLFLGGVVRAVHRELSGSPAASRRAPRVRRSRSPRAELRLRVLEPASARGQTFPLGEEVTIGRAPGCSVALAADSFVSALHARVFLREGEAFVEDLGSTNGTYLNRDRLSGALPLRAGDRLQVGHTVLEVVA
ncbi:MAG: FHA domain-containing protein [Acidimicrobiia bacterium]